MTNQSLRRSIRQKRMFYKTNSELNIPLPSPIFPRFDIRLKNCHVLCNAKYFHMCDGKIRCWAHSECSYMNRIHFIYHMLNSSPIDTNISVLHVVFRQFLLFIVGTYKFAPSQSSGLDRLYCAYLYACGVLRLPCTVIDQY